MVRSHHLAWLLSSLFLLLAGEARGQAVFADRWTNPGPVSSPNSEVGWGLEVLDQENALGVFETRVSQSQSPDTISLVLFSIHHAPVTIWRQTIETTTFSIQTALSPDQDHIYIAVNTHDADSLLIQICQVYKVSMAGDLIWERILQTKDVESVNDILVLPDGKIIFTGTGADLELSISNDWFTKCYNPEGQLLWENYIRTSGHEFGRSLALNHNDEIIVGGVLQFSGGSPGGNAAILALDQSGQELWRRNTSLDTARSSLNTLVINDSGEIYALVSDGQTDLVKMDHIGEMIWIRDGEGLTSFLTLDPSDNPILVRNHFNSGFELADMLKYSPEGDSIAHGQYQVGSEVWIKDITPFPDGGIGYLGSIAEMPNSLAEDGWFVKVNCQGEFLADQAICTSPAPFDFPEVENLIILKDLLSAPFLGLEEGQSGSIELFNLMGQEVSSWLGQSDRNSGIDLQPLPEGWYVYRLRSGNEFLKTGRIQLIY